MRRPPVAAWVCVAGCGQRTDFPGDICAECFGRKSERADIVAWLGSMSSDDCSAPGLAKRIQRGDHAKGGR